jgi:uncharacterized protein (DUF1697 family)
MDRYVAFLRGMNLGGRRITNEELRRAVSEFGFEEVGTFRASGNVILAAPSGSEGAIADRLEAGLGEALGYEVPVFLRNEEEVRAIVAREPFEPRHMARSKGKHQVALLRERPSAKARREALALATDDDRLAIEGRELHWLPSGGISESDLDLDAIGTALGPTTVRTMGTIEQIVATKLGGII